MRAWRIWQQHGRIKQQWRRQLHKAPNYHNGGAKIHAERVVSRSEPPRRTNSLAERKASRSEHIPSKKNPQKTRSSHWTTIDKRANTDTKRTKKRLKTFEESVENYKKHVFLIHRATTDSKNIKALKNPKRALRRREELYGNYKNSLHSAQIKNNLWKPF